MLIRLLNRFTKLAVLLSALLAIPLLETKAQTPVALAPVARQQFFASNGAPLAGGCVFTYAAGTTTPQATYIDSSGTVPNTNPIILDAGGFATIYLANLSYKFTVLTSGGVNCATGGQVWSQDNVSSYAQLSQLASLTLICAASDPTGFAGEIACRSDLGKLRFFFSIWDSIVTEGSTALLTNKTVDISTNVLKTAVNTIGHYPRNNGTQYVDSTIQTADLPTIGAANLAPQYTKFECSPGIGDGLNAISAGTYLQFSCINRSGVTWTITAISCWTDNNGASTLQAANNAAVNLLTVAVTCNNVKSGGGAFGSQSGTTTLANNDAISFTFVADGTTKQTTWTVYFTQ